MDKKEIQRRMTALEGKEIFMINNGQKEIGVISGCDYYVGISIQNTYNKDRYIYCYNGPYSPHKVIGGDYSVHDDEMEIFLSYAEAEVFDQDKYINEINITSGLGGTPSYATCAFV